MTSKRRYRLGLFALLGVALAQADEPLSVTRQREVLRAALCTYEQAVQLEATNPAQATDLFQHAVEGFLALHAAGVRNAALEYNLGRAYGHLGQPGRAILHHRRADRLKPQWRANSAALEQLREHVEPRIVPAEAGALAIVGEWLEDTAPMGRLVVLALGSILGWATLFGGVRRRRHGWLVVGVVAVLVGAAAGISLQVQLSRDRRCPPAVVVNGDTYLNARRGPAASPARGLRLGPGVELRIVQQRGDWLEVRLDDGQAGWVPAATVAPI